MNGQLSIFDVTMPEVSIDKFIRLIELFAGIGSTAMALRELDVEFEHYRVVEFDKFAIRSYNAIHGTNFPAIDIRDIRGSDLGIVDKDKYYYILTYSFPCQDLSVAGKGKGMAKDSGTRSGLLWEVERLLNETEELPDILLMENVPQVHSKKNMPDFQKWLDFLKSKDYSNYWQDLNAKDYGVAQNRVRCFMVSILGNYNYRFPEPIPLTRCIDDYCEENVPECYYINSEKADELIEKLIEDGKIGNGGACDLTVNNPKMNEIVNCITAKDRGISNQESTGNGVIEEVILENYYLDENNYNQRQTVHPSNSICRTIMGGGSHSGNEPKIIQKFRIRKLTEQECWRLMGFSDEDFEKATAVNSKTQLYKQAGNAIAENCLIAIFSQLGINGVKKWNDGLKGKYI